MNTFFLLKKCDIVIDHNRDNILEQIEEIFEDDDYCDQIVFGDCKDMYRCITDRINDTGTDCVLAGINLSETKDNLYVLHYIDTYQPTDEETDEPKCIDQLNINLFASQLAEEPVYGNAVICRMKILYDFNGNNVSAHIEPDTIIMRDFIEKIGEKFIKRGIVMNTDGSLDSYKYVSNPLEPLIARVDGYDKFFRYHEYEFFNMVLQVVVDTREERTDKNINHNASFICNQLVYGRSWIGMYRKPCFNEIPPYITIDCKVLERIIRVRNQSPTSGTNVSVSPEHYINFYMMLELETNRISTHEPRNIKAVVQKSLNEII